MKVVSAGELKNAFGLMIEAARASPVLIEKHGHGAMERHLHVQADCGFS
jgi:hypothetical protein